MLRTYTGGGGGEGAWGTTCPLNGCTFQTTCHPFGSGKGCPASQTRKLKLRGRFLPTFTLQFSDQGRKGKPVRTRAATALCGESGSLALSQAGKLRHTRQWLLGFEHCVQAHPAMPAAHSTLLQLSTVGPPPDGGSRRLWAGAARGGDRLGTNQDSDPDLLAPRPPLSCSRGGRRPCDGLRDLETNSPQRACCAQKPKHTGRCPLSPTPSWSVLEK